MTRRIVNTLTSTKDATHIFNAPQPPWRMLCVEILGFHRRKSLFGSSFIYRIKTVTTTTSPEIPPPPSGIPSSSSEYYVFRTYKHFKQLYQSLISQYPGVMIPYLYPSSVEQQISGEILQQNLQSFLQEIISHPILQSSNSVLIFLQGSIEKFVQECQQLRYLESQRRSSLYLPGLIERMENKLNTFLNGEEWYFGVNHIDFRMREIVEYIDQLQSASETFLSTSKSYFESKQKLYQPLFSWEKSLQCALLEDGIFFTQTERKPLNLASYLMKSNQIDGEVLQVCFTRYHQNILTLQVTLKRWKDRKTKLLSAAKHLSIKRQELLDKEMVKEDNQQQDDLSTPGPKTCTSFFDKLIFKRGGGTSKALPSPNYVEGIREVMPDTVVPPPSSPITINNLEEKTHLLSAGNIDISENTPGTNLDDNPLNSTSPSEIDHWTLIVHELQAEYKQLSDQTLDEFHRFMENKRRSLLDALIEYSSRQLLVCQEVHQVWEDTMSCLLVDNPSYDPTTPLQSHLALSISHSQHSFINKFGLINLPPLNASDKHEPVGDTPYGDSDRQQQIRPIHSVLGDEGREDEYCPLYVSEAGTVEI